MEITYPAITCNTSNERTETMAFIESRIGMLYNIEYLTTDALRKIKEYILCKETHRVS